MKVTREHGLVLNKKKCEVKSNSVKFCGCVYDKYEAHPDPLKVSAIKEMPAPQNKGELQNFLGMVSYHSPFIPQLSSHTATLRGLTCVFGAEHFWTYVFGRHFTIESDHKSLEQIAMKNLADAPVHLQRIYSDFRIMISQSSITQ